MRVLDLFEKWTEKYKRSIDCSNPKGFSQKAHCAGRKKTNESKPNLMDGFRNLLPIAVKHLNLPSIPKIHLNKEQSGTHQASFGGYDSGTDDIHLTISNRHPVDVLRTLAHELVHYKQKLNGELVDDSWKTGSDAENEANAEAGIIMRMFNKQYPKFMGVPPIISETIRKIGPSKWRLYSKDGKKNLGTFDSLKAAKKHEREVQYFKHLGEMSHREAEKILKKHHYHLERQHGGHEIWKDEEGHTFALPHKHHGKDLSTGVEHELRKEVSHMEENFADGKVQGKSRPGRVKKAGASCKGSVSDLRAKAKKYSGEKGKMYHWCANMKGGKK